MMGARMQRLVAIVLAGVSLAACEDEVIVAGRGLPTAGGDGGAAPGAPPSGDGTPLDPGQALEAPDAGIVPLSYRDEDFVEADTNRDPFRPHLELFVTRTRTPQATQREVIMPRTSIEEMRLIAIVSGVANPSAMLVDTDGTGHTVRRGDYIGRPEVVQTGGEDAVPITLNWRVDRIRPGEVVLTREDPTAPNRPPLTRVLALHEIDALENDGAAL